MQTTATSIDTQIDKKKLKAFWQISKPGVCILVVFSGLIGICLAPGHIDFLTASITILCLWVGAGAAAAFNMYYDRDIDCIMKRTQKRPIPAGILSPAEVLEFAFVLSFLSIFLMCMFVNALAAFILLISIIYYSYIYTILLKRHTPQNIVIGGAVGGFAPLVGWASITSYFSMMPLILFLIIFLWTPPHFWALALFRNDDYKLAGVPMLPAVRGVKHTTYQMIFYGILLLLVSISPFFFGYCSIFYLISAIICNLIFLYYLVLVHFHPTAKNSIKAFICSIYYLFALLGLLLIDHYFFI